MLSNQKGLIGLIVLPVILIASSLAYGSITLWQLDKSLNEEEIRLENDMARLASVKYNFDALHDKITLYREAGLDTSHFEEEIKNLSSLVSQKQFEMAEEKFAYLSEQADEALAEKTVLEEKAASEAKIKLETKIDDFRNQGVDVSEADKSLAEARSLIDGGDFKEALEKILAIERQLDELLLKKKEEDKKRTEEEARRKAQQASSQVNQWSLYERKLIQTSRGVFTVDMVTINLANPSLRVITDSGNSGNCFDNCSTKPLSQYVSDHGGFAGINGSYFCPPDYASCAGKVSTFDTPLFNSRLGKIINSDKLFWNGRGFFTFDKSNKVHFFQEARDYNGLSISAGVGNFPALIAGGRKVLNESLLDDKMRTAKISRGGIGNKGHFLYILIARGATVGDLAAIFEALGCENAMNLDGGGSSALFYNGYKVGPGRSLPNAVIFAQ